MTTRVILLAAASTSALRSARIADDEPLDDAGRQEVFKAGSALARTDRATRSPARACEETAALLGRRAAVDPLLRDWELGAWRGRTLGELSISQPTELEAWLSDPDSAAHGGESLTGLFQRVGIWLAGVADEDRRILAITHPAIIRCAAALVLDAPSAAFWKIDIGPLSQTVLHASEQRWRLRAVNRRPDST
jgi:broad specificity phosphatase PhoE